jgi:hypothetical protein
MLKMKNKLLSLVVIGVLSFSSAVFAAPKGVISILYYKTSAKQELVGYWYQSCYLGFNAFWGTRSSYRVNEPMHGMDCTELGTSGNNRGQCFAYSFNNENGVILNSEVNYITQSCEAENPIYTFPGTFPG